MTCEIGKYLISLYIREADYSFSFGFNSVEISMILIMKSGLFVQMGSVTADNSTLRIAYRFISVL